MPEIRFLPCMRQRAVFQDVGNRAGVLEESKIVYVIYIVTSAEKVWKALTDASLTRQYFFGHSVESNWEIGSLIRYWQSDGKLAMEGMVTESVFPHRLSLRRKVISHKAFTEQPDTIVKYRIDSLGPVVRLTLNQSYDTIMEERRLKAIRRLVTISLSGMKTLLETGKPLPKFNVMG